MSSESEVLLVAKRFRVVREIQRTADGALHAREIVQHPGSVVILPMVDADRVCLIRNERVAVHGTLIELPAGTLEPDEDATLAAGRELAEETGYRAGSIERLTSFYVSPGILNERMYLFLATQLTEGPTALEAGEEIEKLVVTWDEALKMVETGTIQDAKTLIGLLLCDRLRRKA